MGTGMEPPCTKARGEGFELSTCARKVRCETDKIGVEKKWIRDEWIRHGLA